MANPALKKGYLPIANELAERFAEASISGSEWRVLWVVLRHTWGWVRGSRRKDWDRISLSQFQRKTRMKRVNVVRILKSLVVKRLLLRSEKGYRINQNYEQWVVVKRLPPVVKRLPVASSQLTTLKRKNNKERNPSSLLAKRMGKKPMPIRPQQSDSVDRMIDEEGNDIRKSSRTKEPLNKTALRLMAWYDREARRERGTKAKYATRGSYQMLVRLLKQHGEKKMREILDAYLDSDKFKKFPQMTAALSDHTIMQFEEDTLE